MDKVVEVHAWRHDAHGFVGHDRDNASNPIVAAFTGTDPFSLPDWVDDLDFIKAAYPFPVCPGGCRVHRGFLEAYLQIREQTLEGLRTLRQAYPDAPVYLTGHSLGGVFATFAAMDVLHALNESVQVLYTFGKPRVGNRAWQVCLSQKQARWWWWGGDGVYQCGRRAPPQSIPQHTNTQSHPPKHTGVRRRLPKPSRHRKLSVDPRTGPHRPPAAAAAGLSARGGARGVLPGLLGGGRGVRRVQPGGLGAAGGVDR